MKRSYRHKKKNSIYIFILLLISLFFYTGISYSIKKPESEEIKLQEINKTINNENNLIVHYIDVGQGDSIFIELPNKETILIDAGEKDKGIIVSDYIKTLGYKEITYLIATHPHSDHIGGLVTILNNFNIKNIYMPKAVSNSSVYKNLLLTIKDMNLSVKTAKKDVIVIDDNELKISFLSPLEKDYEEINNYSAVLKIIYKNKSFLFMGDAEKLIENEITDNLKADVIKIGHHGSKTSSSPKFIKEVNPEYVIISVGADNKYDHPNDYVVKRWETTKAKIYRTDINGTIKILTDGENINVITQRKEE